MKRLIQLGAFILAIGMSLPALAMGLDEAKQKLESVKQQGLVGETPTGYLDVVRADGEAREVVEAINSARRIHAHCRKTRYSGYPGRNRCGKEGDRQNALRPVRVD